MNRKIVKLIKSIIPFILLALLLGSCDFNLFPEDNCVSVDCLPEITQTGEYTLGYLENGEPVNVRNTNNIVAIYQGGFLQFGGNGIYMIVDEPFEINTPIDLAGISSYYIDSDPSVGCHYEFEDSYRGELIFSKIDRINYIVSGTFHFSINNDDCENIDITEGRFDIRYIP